MGKYGSEGIGMDEQDRDDAGEGSDKGPTEGPMRTNGGKHPGVPRSFKSGGVKTLTSRKSQQMNGGC